MRSRILRLSAATLLIGAAVATVAPHATNHISSSAVVNAPLLAVRAPFSGLLSQGSAAFASPVAAGSTLLRLGADRLDQDAVEAVQAEITATDAEVAALVTQIATVEGMQADLRQRIAAHDAAALDYLEMAKRVADAALDRAGAQLRQIEAERARLSRLAASGTATEAALDEIEARHGMAIAEVDEAAARRESVGLEARSLREGITLGPATDAMDYARQRLDEVTLQLAELRSRRDRLSGRRGALDAQLVAMASDLARRTSFEPVAPDSAVVWRAAPADGSSVAEGDLLMELLDCRNRFVEVSLPGRLFEEIRPGDPATILFKGASDRIGAHVEAVGGAGARFDHPSLASDPPEVDDGDIQVLVRLDPTNAGSPEVAASFCDVGRMAEVRFARLGQGPLDWAARTTASFGTWVQDLVPSENQIGAMAAGTIGRR